jgi:rod shape determining protein RodA
MSILGEREARLTLRQKLWDINWGLVLLLSVVAGIGFVMLYSVANGSIDPWARLQMIRFGAGLVLMFIVALIDIRVWMRYAYLIYAVGILLLVGVEFMGTIGMGAQRWIDLGVFRLQPSEVVKIALVLALARYFHGRQLEDVSRPHYLIAPILLVAVPVALVLRQPDLGTAILLALGSGALFLLAGVRLWMFGAVFAAVMAAIPVAWQFLRDYQKDRILTFLEPERDPLGAGYHTMQSKIALGSGGITGKGYMEGTQSHLNFLPEKHTDFIFTMVGEEFGLVGGLAIVGLYILIMAYGYAIAMRSRNQFGRLVALGITTTLFLYVFINVAMVMGLVPVVGVPLPMISFGGTAMMALLIGFGLVISVFVHRDVEIPRRSGGGLP